MKDAKQLSEYIGYWNGQVDKYIAFVKHYDTNAPYSYYFKLRSLHKKLHADVLKALNDKPCKHLEELPNILNERKAKKQHFSFVEFIENWEHFKAYWDQLCKCYRLESEETVMEYKNYVKNDTDDAGDDAEGPFFEFRVDILEFDPKPAKEIDLSSLQNEA